VNTKRQEFTAARASHLPCGILLCDQYGACGTLAPLSSVLIEYGLVRSATNCASPLHLRP
jgi:hypothetical protein